MSRAAIIGQMNPSNLEMALTTLRLASPDQLLWHGDASRALQRELENLYWHLAQIQ